jgi:Putative transposase
MPLAREDPHPFALTFTGGTRSFHSLLHVLPGGFHRIRHYGLLANPVRRASLARIRTLLDVTPATGTQPADLDTASRPAFICRHCGAPMIVIDILERSAPIRGPPTQRGET